jgi:hypothetical protein
MGSIKFAFMAAIVTVFCGFILMGLWGIGAAIFTGATMNVPGVILCGFFGFGVLAYAAYATEALIKKLFSISYSQTQKDPGFAGLAYRKFKDKTCFKINFK